MALNKDKDLKKYFSISEVATQFGVAESVLLWQCRCAVGLCAGVLFVDGKCVGEIFS